MQAAAVAADSPASAGMPAGHSRIDRTAGNSPAEADRIVLGHIEAGTDRTAADRIGTVHIESAHTAEPDRTEHLAHTAAEHLVHTAAGEPVHTAAPAAGHTTDTACTAVMMGSDRSEDSLLPEIAGTPRRSPHHTESDCSDR